MVVIDWSNKVRFLSSRLSCWSSFEFERKREDASRRQEAVARRRRAEPEEVRRSCTVSSASQRVLMCGVVVLFLLLGRQRGWNSSTTGASTAISRAESALEARSGKDSSKTARDLSFSSRTFRDELRNRAATFAATTRTRARRPTSNTGKTAQSHGRSGQPSSAADTSSAPSLKSSRLQQPTDVSTVLSSTLRQHPPASTRRNVVQSSSSDSIDTNGPSTVWFGVCLTKYFANLRAADCLQVLPMPSFGTNARPTLSAHFRNWTLSSMQRSLLYPIVAATVGAVKKS